MNAETKPDGRETPHRPENVRVSSPNPRLSLIVAMAKNRVIGANNAVPWHLPGELKMFKSITMGHHIIMGRKTWESIGRLLPGRTTIVVTRQRDYAVPGAKIADSLESALAACQGDDEIFVIGGAQLFAAALPRADRIYLTVVDAEVGGDIHLPDFDLGAWRERSSQAFSADDKNPFSYKLTVYDRA